MTTLTRSMALAGLLAASVFTAPSVLAAGGGHGGASGFHGGGVFAGSRGGDARGGYGHGYGGRGGYYRGGYYRGGYYRGGSWGPGPFWGGIGLGLGVGALVYSSGYYGPAYGGTYDTYSTYGDSYDDVPAPVVVVPARPVYGAVESPVVVRSGRPVPVAAPRAPEPIFYPRNGQSGAALESDRRECNRWATTQPNAMADGSIFQRATFACMEGRGYTVK